MKFTGQQHDIFLSTSKSNKCMKLKYDMINSKVLALHCLNTMSVWGRGVCVGVCVCVCVTFDVSLVSDGLQGRTSREELLQLVSRLLVLGGVRAGGALHGCSVEMRKHIVFHPSCPCSDVHDGRSMFGRNETDKQLFYGAGKGSWDTGSNTGKSLGCCCTLIFSCTLFIQHFNLSLFMT